MVEVKLWGALSAVTDGKDRLEIEAKDIRELFRKLREEYPGVEPYVKQGIAVAIDGVLYRDNWSKELPIEGEIFLLPRMAGG
jgi:sulfur-carrier protein